MTAADLLAKRAAVIAALPRDAEPYDLVAPLVELEGEASASNLDELSQRLRLEMTAAGTHASFAGRPERSARFDFVADQLRAVEALQLLSDLAGGTEMPPLARAHYLDLVWSLETTPRAHPLAGRAAVEAYLDHDAAVGEVPDPERDTSGWASWSDALARACELASETGQRDVAHRAASAVRGRIDEALALGCDRIVLEPGYGLLAMSRIAPEALDGLPALLQRARERLLAAKQHRLGRSVIDLEVAVAGALRLADALPEPRRRKAESCVAEADERAADGGLVASVLIQDAIEVLRGVPGSEERVAELTRRLERENRSAGEHMSTISSEVRIPTEQVEAFYRTFTNAPLADALALVGHHFLLDRAKAYARYDANAAGSVFARLATHKLVTEYGETMTFAPGTAEFRDYMVFREALQGMALGGTFIAEILVRLRARGLDAAAVGRYLDECPVISPSARDLIDDGVARVFAADHVGAVHVLVPQIEAMLRGLVEGAGLPITRVREGRSEMLLLEALLGSLRRHGVLEDTMLFTLEVVLGRLGWNIRNRVAHGWITKADCTSAVSQRLLQLVLAFGLLRKDG